MKMSMNRANYLGAAASLILAVVAFAATDTPVQFTGSVQGQETDTLQGNPPSAISVDGSVAGIASHLGRFTLAYQVTVSLPAGNSTGKATVTTPSGDMIFTTIVGQGISVPGTGTLNSVMEVNAITGGAGRFEGATGYLIVYRLIDLASGLTSGSVVGALTLPSR